MTSGNAGDGSVPAARFEDLIATESADDVLVYDSASHHIHHLNAVSAAIWRLCDGQRSVEELAHAASLELGDDVSAQSVRLALGKLADARLLAGAVGEPTWGAGQSRRAFLRRAAVAGAATVPAVVSISAPASAQIYSGICGEPCESEDDCAEGPCTICGGFLDEHTGICCSVTGHDPVCTA